MKKKSAVVIGVGPVKGLGAALCCKFASEGYHVFIAGRTPEKIEEVAVHIRAEGGSADTVCLDAGDESAVIRLFDEAFNERDDLQPPDLVVFNAGNNKKIDFLNLTTEEAESFWRTGCLAGLITGREAVKRMLPLGKGSILFTGASSSLRGKPGFVHFSSAKAGLRMLSQAMAREFGPQGIHVAHVILDGVIDGDRLQHSPATSGIPTENLLNINAMADNYWFLHMQDSSTWTQELDLRPSVEPF
ncbi:SDR family NAD(P)-dependent oxidoreductase [Klebsiella michiganensis]|uniref:SDR family NAD(P)-dependent oxidoreductase n=1 Tax=Klebsiella michiganensis TaxID=1134687 RepID=UPI0032DB625E